MQLIDEEKLITNQKILKVIHDLTNPVLAIEELAFKTYKNFKKDNLGIDIIQETSELKVIIDNLR